MSIALAMIVRDAAKTVERCIRSALPLVDRAVIIDTGSVDGTKDAVRAAVDGVPLDLSDSEWVGHAHNRSELLARVRESGADYCLQLDADMVVEQRAPLRELTKDEYLIPIHDRGLVYPLPLLTSTRKQFYYAGVAHSYLACHDGPTEGELLDELVLLDLGGGGNRPGKIERDAELLAAEVAKDPTDRRSWFYLAQSYRDLDQHEKAAQAYKMRASLGGWDEEVYYSLYQAGALMSQHIDAREGMRLLLDAWISRPSRAEALRALSNVAASVADKIPLPTDVLFVTPSAYRHQARRQARAEVEEIFFHRYMPKQGDVVVELGAAEGTETPLLSNMVGPSGHVLAVDAHPQMIAALSQRVAGLGNVRVVHAAVQPHTGTATISDDPIPWHNRIVDGDGIKVPGKTLDQLTAKLERIDLLKINIEGSEADVLKTAKRTLAKTRNVVVSCHDFVGWPTKQRSRAALEAAGFNVVGHDDPLIIEDGHNGRCLGDYLYARRLLSYDQISVAIVTRGDVSLGPTLEPIPFPDVHIWDNSKRENLRTLGRVKILDECENDVIFTVDDDVIFTEFDRLIEAYEPGLWICNMDQPWIDGAGYGDFVSQSGAGSLYERRLPREAVERYLDLYPRDELFLTYCDIVTGVLSPFRRVDLGYQVREFADGPNRTYTQPGANERKWEMINRCLAILNQMEAA